MNHAFSTLQAANPSITLHTLSTEHWPRYGRVLQGEFAEPLQWMNDNLAMPIAQETRYQRSLPGLEDCPGPALPLYPGSDSPGPGPVPGRASFQHWVSSVVFGGQAVQLGAVWGKNQSLNALEYHKSSELILTCSDVVLFLGQLKNLKDFKSYDVADIKAFYFPAGTLAEIYATSLHFAPVMTNSEGFRVMIALPQGTNAPLPRIQPACESETGLLWAVNKWLIACENSIPAKRGARVGIHTNLKLELA